MKAAADKTFFLSTPSGHEIAISATQKAAIETAMQAGTKTLKLNGNLLTLSGVSIFDHPKPRAGFYFCQYENWHQDNATCGCYEQLQQQKNSQPTKTIA